LVNLLWQIYLGKFTLANLPVNYRCTENCR
jgi:hypothetical protein